ncbi:hypothetical protein QT441_22445, partial [Xanthomonas citri pv. citri]
YGGEVVSDMGAPLGFPQQDSSTFFIGGDLSGAATGESHMPFFGDMGVIPEHELQWDSLPSYANTFSTTTGAANGTVTCSA